MNRNMVNTQHKRAATPNRKVSCSQKDVRGAHIATKVSTARVGAIDFAHAEGRLCLNKISSWCVRARNNGYRKRTHARAFERFTVTCER